MHTPCKRCNKFGMICKTCKGLFLTLSLFVFGIFTTNDHNSAVAFDNLAFVAHGFYAGFNFHF